VVSKEMPYAVGGVGAGVGELEISLRGEDLLKFWLAAKQEADGGNKVLYMRSHREHVGHRCHTRSSKRDLSQTAK
jgi:hypothetical protein